MLWLHTIVIILVVKSSSSTPLESFLHTSSRPEIASPADHLPQTNTSVYQRAFSISQSTNRLLSQSNDGIVVEEKGYSTNSCQQWIRSGNAETGSIDDWSVMDGHGGVLAVNPNEGPPGSTRSFQIYRRFHFNTGPGQELDVSCFEVGRQYKVSALIKVINEDGSPYSCDKFAEWTDPDFCPIFTIWTMSSTQISRFNMGNDVPDHLNWQVDEWNAYHAIFTVDERMSKMGDAFIYFRGVRAFGTIILFDDVSITEYVGVDTRYNFWTTVEIEPVDYGDASDSDNNETNSEITEKYTNWKYYKDGETYVQYEQGSCKQLIKNGNAEVTNNTKYWESLGSTGGAIFLHNHGPNEDTKSFQHVDRPQFNTGPGQSDLPTSCFEEGHHYEFKAKLKLLDDNGFPFPCNKANPPGTFYTCPMITIFIPSYDDDGATRLLILKNDVKGPWVADAFNEFHAVFTAPAILSDAAPGSSWMINGPQAGVRVLFDDVTLMETDAYGPPKKVVRNGYTYDSHNKVRELYTYGAPAISERPIGDDTRNSFRTCVPGMRLFTKTWENDHWYADAAAGLTNYLHPTMNVLELRKDKDEKEYAQFENCNAKVNDKPFGGRYVWDLPRRSISRPRWNSLHNQGTYMNRLLHTHALNQVRHSINVTKSSLNYDDLFVPTMTYLRFSRCLETKPDTIVALPGNTTDFIDGVWDVHGQFDNITQNLTSQHANFTVLVDNYTSLVERSTKSLASSRDLLGDFTDTVQNFNTVLENLNQLPVTLTDLLNKLRGKPTSLTMLTSNLSVLPGIFQRLLGNLTEYTSSLNSDTLLHKLKVNMTESQGFMIEGLTGLVDNFLTLQNDLLSNLSDVQTDKLRNLTAMPREVTGDLEHFFEEMETIKILYYNLIDLPPDFTHGLSETQSELVGRITYSLGIIVDLQNNILDSLTEYQIELLKDIEEKFSADTDNGGDRRRQRRLTDTPPDSDMEYLRNALNDNLSDVQQHLQTALSDALNTFLDMQDTLFGGLTEEQAETLNNLTGLPAAIHGNIEDLSSEMDTLKESFDHLTNDVPANFTDGFTSVQAQMYQQFTYSVDTMLTLQNDLYESLTDVQTEQLKEFAAESSANSEPINKLTFSPSINPEDTTSVPTVSMHSPTNSPSMNNTDTAKNAESIGNLTHFPSMSPTDTLKSSSRNSTGLENDNSTVSNTASSEESLPNMDNATSSDSLGNLFDSPTDSLSNLSGQIEQNDFTILGNGSGYLTGVSSLPTESPSTYPLEDSKFENIDSPEENVFVNITHSSTNNTSNLTHSQEKAVELQNELISSTVAQSKIDNVTDPLKSFQVVLDNLNDLPGEFTTLIYVLDTLIDLPELPDTLMGNLTNMHIELMDDLRDLLGNVTDLPSNTLSNLIQLQKEMLSNIAEVLPEDLRGNLANLPPGLIVDLEDMIGNITHLPGIYKDVMDNLTSLLSSLTILMGNLSDLLEKSIRVMEARTRIPNDFSGFLANVTSLLNHFTELPEDVADVMRDLVELLDTLTESQGAADELLGDFDELLDGSKDLLGGTKDLLTSTTGLLTRSENLLKRTTYLLDKSKYLVSNSENLLDSSKALLGFTTQLVGSSLKLLDDSREGLREITDLAQAHSITPSASPTDTPTSAPSSLPSATPSSKPSASPSHEPSLLPTLTPSVVPTSFPTASPSSQPSSKPSSTPSRSPSETPSTLPTLFHSHPPTLYHSKGPSTFPSISPTSAPSVTPTEIPSLKPSDFPTSEPSVLPTSKPSSTPTKLPSMRPSGFPTSEPSFSPTANPSVLPSTYPTGTPSRQPSMAPSTVPTLVPTANPSSKPSISPTNKPSQHPSIGPTAYPSNLPSNNPTSSPTASPSSKPTVSPSNLPSTNPTSLPTTSPSGEPSTIPTSNPTQFPSTNPTLSPSVTHSIGPTIYHSSFPTKFHSAEPTSLPSKSPTTSPSISPSVAPTMTPSSAPTKSPTGYPSVSPSAIPTKAHSVLPSVSFAPSESPSLTLSAEPTAAHSILPTVSHSPSESPSRTPSSSPTEVHSILPSVTYSPSESHSKLPSAAPTEAHSILPSVTHSPSGLPSKYPSSTPTSAHSILPSVTSYPTKPPSRLHSSKPTAIHSVGPSSSYIPTNPPSKYMSTRPTVAHSILPSTSQLPTYRPTLAHSTTPSSSHSPSISPTKHTYDVTNSSANATMSPDNFIEPKMQPDNFMGSEMQPDAPFGFFGPFSAMFDMIEINEPTSNPGDYLVMVRHEFGNFTSELRTSKALLGVFTDELDGFQDQMIDSTASFEHFSGNLDAFIDELSNSTDSLFNSTDELGDFTKELGNSTEFLGNLTNQLDSSTDLLVSLRDQLSSFTLSLGNVTDLLGNFTDVLGSVTDLRRGEDTNRTCLASNSTEYRTEEEYNCCLDHYDIDVQYDKSEVFIGDWPQDAKPSGENWYTDVYHVCNHSQAVEHVDSCRVTVLKKKHARYPSPLTTNCVVVFYSSGELQKNKTGLVDYCGWKVQNGVKEELRNILGEPGYKKIKTSLSTCRGSISAVGHSFGGSIADVFTMCANYGDRFSSDYWELMWPTPPPPPCFELIKSGDAQRGKVSDWTVKEVNTGEIVKHYGDGPPNGSNRCYKHINRGHASSGPGQELDTSCFVVGKQYILRAMIKIEHQEHGYYACDKFAEWGDDDFCPLFAIYTNHTNGIAKYNLGNDFPRYRTWQEGSWNHYRAVFTVDERLANCNSAYIYVRGPPANVTIYFDDVSIRRYVGTPTNSNFWTSPPPPLGLDSTPGDTTIIDDCTCTAGYVPGYTLASIDYSFNYKYFYRAAGGPCPVPGTCGPCKQLVKNGNADDGDFSAWQIISPDTESGSVELHNNGPQTREMSFKHVGRKTFNSGPGQYFDRNCMVAGMIYEIIVKIKLLDVNGFAYSCTGNVISSPKCCPILTIVIVLPTGEIRYINKVNDLDQPWYPDEYNEFHAVFPITDEMVSAVKVYWFIRGPPEGATMLFTDVSISDVELEDPDAKFQREKSNDCSDLIIYGDANSGTVLHWDGFDGDGFMTIADGIGPQSNINQTRSFKFLARTQSSNGPGQKIYVGCLEPSRTYLITAKIYHEDYKGDPYACDTDVEWGHHLFCTWATLHTTQPWGEVKFNFPNEVSEPMVAGWNDFEAHVTITGAHEYPTDAHIYFRGPPMDSVIYINNVNMTMVNDAPEHSPMTVLPKDPEYVCEGFCNELVVNGDAEDVGIAPWFTVGEDGVGSILSYDKGADGSLTSIRHTNRVNINSGPGQYIDSGCFHEGEIYELKAKILIMNEDGNFTTCEGGASWNDPDFCPLFSFAARTETGRVHWIDVPNDLMFGESNITWASGEFNEYHSYFKANGELANAKELYFLFRGSPVGVDIIVDSVSLSPYQHCPYYNGNGDPGFEDALFDINSGTKTVIKGYNETLCPDIVVNGDLKTGDTTGWKINGRGILSVRACDVEGVEYCLQHSQRISRCMGPSQQLPLDCIEVGREFKVKAHLKMLDEAWRPYGCDKRAGRFSNCPLMSIKYVEPESGKWKWIYIGNQNLSPWQGNEYNEFYGTFKVTEELASATKAFWYFERPPPGISILIGGVSIEEFVPETDPDYKEKSEKCEDFVLNGDAERGDTRGWTSRLGGDIDIKEGGADLTRYSFVSSGRHSFIMGPKHDFVPKCFIPGMVYKFEARMKLVVEETGAPFECYRTHLWASKRACPLLTFQLTYDNDKTEWMYFNDETKGTWQKDSWNYFHATFHVSPELNKAIDGSFYFERVRAGVNIHFDEVKIYRDCTALIPNWGAEQGKVSPWIQYGGADTNEITTYVGGFGGSRYAFASKGRQSFQEGPGHALDVGCLLEGRKLQFVGYFKLLDESNDDEHIICDKVASWSDPQSCPLVSIVMNLPTGNKVLNIENSDSNEWDRYNFNRYFAKFEIPADIVGATSAHMVIRGPRSDVSIIFDNIQISADEEEDIKCEDLIQNSQFETSDMTDWEMKDNGRIATYNEGANGSFNSLLATDRLSTSDGPMTKINNKCLLEGRQYELTAYIKLLDEEMSPYACDKEAQYGNPQSCPVLEVGLDYENGVSHTHPENVVPNEWIADGWNMYRAIFTVSNDLARAEHTYLKFKGPFSGISMVLDNVQTTIYRPPVVDCDQMIISTNAESGAFTGWQAHGSGHVKIVEGGDNSTKAFGHFGRNDYWSGPGQMLESECLEEGKEYMVNARFKLLDRSGEPVACDRHAEWRDENYCLLMTFEMESPSGEKERLHVGSTYGGDWIADDFNSFRTNVTVTPAMADAKSTFFFFQGPRADVSIVFDNISMKAKEIES